MRESPWVALASVFSWRRAGVALLAATLVAAGVVAVRTVGEEIQPSRHQAARLTRLADELRFEVQAGTSDSIHFPGNGPYDQRLGYHALPGFVEELTAKDFRVSAQARISPQLAELSERGLFAPYHEKTQAGLELFDCRGEPLFAARAFQSARMGVSRRFRRWSSMRCCSSKTASCSIRGARGSTRRSNGVGWRAQSPTWR